MATCEVRLTVAVRIHGTETVLVLRLGFQEVLLGLLHDPALHLLGADTPVFVGINSGERKTLNTVEKPNGYGRNGSNSTYKKTLGSKRRFALLFKNKHGGYLVLLFAVINFITTAETRIQYFVPICS